MAHLERDNLWAASRLHNLFERLADVVAAGGLEMPAAP
jgi:hypothetical protein